MKASYQMGFMIIGIGEVLWDLLPSGPQLGGAPANFAYHAHALGARARIVTRVGNDKFGRTIRQRFDEQGIADGTVQVDDTAPTGTVTVALSDMGNPNYLIHENVAWDHLLVTQPALEAVRSADALCFGSLAQRNPISRAAIRKLVAAAPAQTLRVFDINLRQNFYSREIIEESLHLANVLKLNDSELLILAEMFGLGESRRQQIQEIAEKFSLRLVVLTCGPQGSLIFELGRWSEQPPPDVKVVDTVGAGDSFTAALVMGWLSKMDLDDLHAAAVAIAGYVCTQPGATPSLPQELRDNFCKAKSRRSGPVSKSVVAPTEA